MAGASTDCAVPQGGWTMQCLLQELLMALVGYTGDVFVDISTKGLNDEIELPDNCTVQLAPDITWAGMEAREQLNELVRLGFHHKQLQKFIQQEQQPDSQKSLYRQALCAGLKEVLAVYEDEVVRLQQVVLQQGADRGVPGILYELADLQMLLPQLHQLVYDLRRRSPRTLDSYSTSTAQSKSSGSTAQGADAAVKGAAVVTEEPLVIPPEACGAKLLATLHAHRLNGQPVLQACLQRLLWHANQVLFNQLTMWMVHGVLADESGEFFVRPRLPIEDVDQDQQQLDDTARQSDTGRQAPAGVSRSMVCRTEDDTYRDWHEAYAVAMLELPPYITPHTATSIEFVGRAVRLLRAPPASANITQLKDRCMHDRSQHPWWSPAEVHQQLLPYEDTLAFASVLRALQQQPVFNQAAFERTVEAIRADVASRLWELLVVKAGLMQHLSAIKDYFLLSKGDFYQCFLNDAARLLAGPVNKATATSDLAAPWLSAAAKSTAQDDTHFKLFKLVHRSRPKVTQQASEAEVTGNKATVTVPAYDSNWDELALEAQMPWPLGVLLTPRCMERYNSMFQLLLRLKRVQLALEQAWQELGRLCGRSGSSTCAADISPLLTLRHHMGHFISNLQIYLQVDVVESQFAQLQAKVAQAQDFSEAEHAHHSFLHALMTQSFLLQGSMIGLFGQVFSHINTLCRLVKGAREQGLDWEAVKDVRIAFDATINQLYVNLHSKTLAQYDKAPYLRQLQMRLDFNQYVSKQMAEYRCRNLTKPK